ncbi:MAG TPA: hypothetical protein VIR30_02530 [Nocardioides sp.]
MSLMRALGHLFTAQRRQISEGGEARPAPVPRSRTSRAVVLVVAALGLALTTPNAYAMDEPFDGAIPMTQTQSRLTSNESSLRPVLSVPAGAADGGKESNPLSVVIPVVLLGVWAGVGVVMFRRARHQRSARRGRTD